jgi:hypothetical protein
MEKKRTVRKNGSVHIYRPIDDDVVAKIWPLLGTFQHQNWDVPLDRKLLASIVGKAKTDAFYAITDSQQQNIQLRTLLREPLRSKDVQKRNTAIKWIVYDWGNIPPKVDENDDRLFKMCTELNDFGDEDVKEFVVKYKIDRIASWSKVLAFADSDKYAIFDARVAMSLNALLDEVNFKRKFYMPQSISKPLNNIFVAIRKKVNADYKGTKLPYMGYREYTTLLNSAVEQGLAPNVLQAEMQLFAQGKKMGNRYARRHKMPIPYPNEEQDNLQFAS